MVEIETSNELAIRLDNEIENGLLGYDGLVRAIEADRAAVANRVLEEIRALAIVIYNDEPVADMNQAVAIACGRTQRKLRRPASDG